MLQGFYASQKYNRELYIKSKLSDFQLSQLDNFDKEVKTQIEYITDDYIRKLNVLLYYTSSTERDIIKVEIGRVLYSQKGARIGGMGGRMNQLFTTRYTNSRSTILLQCYDELKSQGYNVTKHWVYTYESKVARQSHVNSDGLVANEDGYFIIDGHLTKAPSMFGIPEQDYNCKCGIKLEVHEP